METTQDQRELALRMALSHCINGCTAEEVLGFAESFLGFIAGEVAQRKLNPVSMKHVIAASGADRNRNG